MKYLFRHPRDFKPFRFNVGNFVWIIEDELQRDGTYIDKVKQAMVTKVSPRWRKEHFIVITIGNRTIRLIPYYEQSESLTLQTDTLERITSDCWFEIFTTEQEANKWFNEHYNYED